MRGLSALDGLAPGSEDVEGVPAALYDSTFSLQKDVLYYKIREYAAACRANKMEETAMEAFYSWYDTLDADEQESFAEAWTMIEPDALSLLSDKDSMAGRIEDAGLDPDTLPGCTLKNWQALQTVLDDCVPAVGQ